MALEGLPDFQRLIRTDACLIFAPYGSAGAYTVMPDALEIADRNNDGDPDILLEYVRPRNPLLPPPAHGILDLRVRPHYEMDHALKDLRARQPNAQCGRAIFSSALLRLVPVGEAAGIPPELQKPVSLGWNGLGHARYTVSMPPSAVALFKAALVGETLVASAMAEVEITGVSPRVPVRVRFDPAALLGKVLPLCDPDRRIAWEDLCRFFLKNAKSLPVEFSASPERLNLEEFAQALADRVRIRFGSFAPAPRPGMGPLMALTAPEPLGTQTFEWNLGDPTEVPRAFDLTLDLIDPARQLVRKHGLDSIFRETVVPAMQTGYLRVSVSADLPPERRGALAVGVAINAPARLPYRVQALAASVELKSPEDSGAVTLRFSPAEKPEYTYKPFAVLDGPKGPVRLEGVATQHEGNCIDVRRDEFPVDFIAIEAGPELLALATAKGSCRWLSVGTVAEQAFELNGEHPVIALALPKGAQRATLQFEAQARNASGSLRLGPLPAGDTHIDLYSFREYGPHEVEIECAAAAGTVTAIDLLPEDCPDSPTTRSLLFFTPDQPKKTWSWFAHSPFYPGYRYRFRRGANEPPAAWSKACSPFEALRISASAVSVGGA